MELADLYQDVILDHGRHPRNFREITNPTWVDEAFNPLCGDRYKIYVQIADGCIMDASFTGQGCAISMASTSLMLEAVIGKSVAYAEELFQAFTNLLTNKQSAADTDVGKLEVMSGVVKFPMRIKCATLAWHVLHAGCSACTPLCAIE